jgi:hypothetical protein
MAARPGGQVFISHSSADIATARSIERALDGARFSVWLDDSDLRIGALLRNELHEGIRKSRVMVFVWSEAASRSRWVSAEVLTAFHMDRFILPCVVDDTPLPQFLARTAYLDPRKNGADWLHQLVRAAEKAPGHANPLPPHVAAPGAELRLTCSRIHEGQARVTGPLKKRDLKSAAAAQAQLDPIMREAERRWRYELMVLNLGGYHRKNGYLIRHWDAIQAGRPPADPLLLEGERLFFEAALVDPLDVSALNGLSSILIYELELEAAAFFNERAIAISRKEGIPYDAASHDKALIDWMKQQQRRQIVLGG